MATFENTDVHFSILPHLDTLPELGDEWHVEDRRKWLESLDATLAALYPIPASSQETVPAPEALCVHDIYSRSTTMLSKTQDGIVYRCQHCPFEAIA